MPAKKKITKRVGAKRITKKGAAPKLARKPGKRVAKKTG